MKRLFFAFLGACFGALLCIYLAYLAGQIWGPLYQGEDESTQNFKIFLLAASFFFVSGGWLGFWISKPKPTARLN